MVMDSSENGSWIIPFKKISRLRIYCILVCIWMWDKRTGFTECVFDNIGCSCVSIDTGKYMCIINLSFYIRLCILFTLNVSLKQFHCIYLPDCINVAIICVFSFCLLAGLKKHSYCSQKWIKSVCHAIYISSVHFQSIVLF